MTPLTHMRLIFVPLLVVGLYIGARVLIPGLLGIVLGLLLVAAGVLWAVLTVRRSRSHEKDRRNSPRRRQGIDGWPNALGLIPFVFMTPAVLIATYVSELMAGVFVIAFVVGGPFLLIRRLRRTP